MENQNWVDPKEYTNFYEKYTDKAKRYHADTTRNDYQEWLWFELTRNKITLAMLGDKCKGKNVIDLGAAHWVEKALLLSIGAASVTKVDIAPAPDDGEVLKVDACDTKLPDNSYDVVICRELIEHVPDADKLMNEICRLLKDDGLLLLSTPNGFSLPPDGTSHVRAYTPRSFIELLRRYDFDILDKRGNAPDTFMVLMPLSEAGNHWALNEFKEIEDIIEKNPDSYYFSTNMFVLAKKGRKP